MAVTYISTGTGNSGSTSCAPAYPASIAAEDYLVLTVTSGGPTAADSVPTAPAGWDLLGTSFNTDGTWGADTGPRRCTLFGRVAAGGESGSITVTIPGGSGSMVLARIERWTKSLDHWVVTGHADSYQLAEGSAASFVFPGVLLATGDGVYHAAAGPDSAVATSGQTFTASGITFAAATETLDSSTALGNNIRLTGCRSTVNSGSGTVTTTVGFTQNESWGSVLLVLHETDSLAGTVTIGIATETDTALAITPAPGSVTVPVGLATETDTALAVTPAPGAATVPLGIASETDTALPVTPAPGPVTVTVGVADETDTALPVQAVPGAATVALGLPVETDTALAMVASTGSGSDVVELGVAAETDTALALTPAPGPAIVQMGVAVETDQALAMVALTVGGVTVVRSRGGDYGGLGAIIAAAVADRRAELEAPVLVCPEHGEPLDIGADGVMSCPFGDYTRGVRPPRVPHGLR